MSRIPNRFLRSPELAFNELLVLKFAAAIGPDDFLFCGE
jgi:hypothetical protein